MERGDAARREADAVLNEINDRDEDTVHLGEVLQLPARYEPYRAQIERQLVPLAG